MVTHCESQSESPESSSLGTSRPQCSSSRLALPWLQGAPWSSSLRSRLHFQHSITPILPSWYISFPCGVSTNVLYVHACLAPFHQMGGIHIFKFKSFTNIKSHLFALSKFHLHTLLLRINNKFTLPRLLTVPSPDKRRRVTLGRFTAYYNFLLQLEFEFSESSFIVIFLCMVQAFSFTITRSCGGKIPKGIQVSSDSRSGPLSF